MSEEGSGAGASSLGEVSSSTKITAAIFDLDGTLLDTEPLYYASYEKVAHGLGKSYTFDVHSHLLGRAELEGAANMIKVLELADITPEEILKRRDVYFLEAVAHAAALPGAINAVRAVKDCGFRVAIATSSKRAYLPLKQDSNPELFSLVDLVVCGDDEAVGGKSKPDPAIFLAAAKQLGVLPSQCVAFEDSLAGIQSALNAHMTVVAVPDPRLPMPDVAALRPHFVLKSLCEFDPSLITSA